MVIAMRGLKNNLLRGREIICNFASATHTSVCNASNMIQRESFIFGSA